jgi:hypothetical protein
MQAHHEMRVVCVRAILLGEPSELMSMRCFPGIDDGDAGGFIGSRVA